MESRIFFLLGYIQLSVLCCRMFTALSEIDRKTSLWLYFNSQMSDFKQFKRGTKTHGHERTKTAINLNWHIHLRSSIKIPKNFKHNKYLLRL